MADYIAKNTDLAVDYHENVIGIPLKQRIDALAALAAAEQSKLDWNEIHTRRDSLDDVFIKLVSGELDEHGEIIGESKANNSNSKNED